MINELKALPPAAVHSMNTEREAIDVKNQLSILIAQMHESGILYSEAVREFKRVFISHVLTQTNGNQCKAAKQLGMHRNTLSRTIAELDLDVREIRKARVPVDGRRPPRSAPPIALEKKAAR
jgi:Fis family transcriptional regulator, factor for inversion stimulation protein